MFPGYLFANFHLAEMHRQVRYTHGVSGIVRFADRYPTIEEGALAQLRSPTGAADITEPNYNLSEGDQVQIVGGAFVGLEAVVTQILSPKERVKVLMEFLGRKMEAEVQRSSVLRQVAHPLVA
jgi:transcriptional antiterminator RfaH